VKWPCFYGIDFATRAELVANGLKVEEIRASIGADSLGYLREDAMIEATGQVRERLCTACFTGDYPIPLPDSNLLGKQFLEALPGLEVSSPRGLDIEGVGTGVAGGAADALSRP
jgi:amidophosphoribosyltransferase